MADVNFEQSVESPASERPAATRPAGSQPAQHYDLVELLFFAYRDFISDPDAILAEIGFGRAHHRVLHFVSRNPGLKVADLLDILKITKQSLGRVLKQLIDEGYIVQREGPSDRRQRLLYATEAGNALALRLARPQFQRFADAIAATGPDDAAAAKRFLMAVVDPRERAAVAALLKGGQGSSGRTLDER
ncbi:MarR family winged helix-turn-helix transcriptional regulator [Tepidamorphus gemmatus]|nr:MarR family transcriptional regulator [Tepidamorphus gemmatus]